MVADYTVGLVIVMTHLTISEARPDRGYPLDGAPTSPDEDRDGQRDSAAHGA
jgi:hypothetical protein